LKSGLRVSKPISEVTDDLPLKGRSAPAPASSLAISYYS
jgi:hypothetical protein